MVLWDRSIKQSNKIFDVIELLDRMHTICAQVSNDTSLLVVVSHLSETASNNISYCYGHYHFGWKSRKCDTQLVECHVAYRNLALSNEQCQHIDWENEVDWILILLFLNHHNILEFLRK